VYKLQFFTFITGINECIVQFWWNALLTVISWLFCGCWNDAIFLMMWVTNLLQGFHCLLKGIDLIWQSSIAVCLSHNIFIFLICGHYSFVRTCNRLIIYKLLHQKQHINHTHITSKNTFKKGSWWVLKILSEICEKWLNSIAICSGNPVFHM